VVAVRSGRGDPMSVWATNPQAAQIDVLIERAGRLTSVECDRLAADWTAAWEAAGDAAWDAARDAAREAAWFAARDAVQAWAAVGDAAWDAAWFAADVVGALVVRDLIEEATPWDWAAYDLLTGPWRRVIGSVHPDDEGASPCVDDASPAWEGWRKVKRAKLDSQGRISLGDAASHDLYEVRVNDVGEFLLLPLVLVLGSDVKSAVDLG
jgi:hypothetical protein